MYMYMSAVLDWSCAWWCVWGGGWEREWTYTSVRCTGLAMCLVGVWGVGEEWAYTSVRCTGLVMCLVVCVGGGGGVGVHQWDVEMLRC